MSDIEELKNDERLTEFETKVETVLEDEVINPPIVKRRKKRTMTPELLEKLALARVKSIEVKKKNAELNNKAKVLKKESDNLKIKLLYKTEKELATLKKRLEDTSILNPEIKKEQESLIEELNEELPEVIEEPKPKKEILVVEPKPVIKPKDIDESNVEYSSTSSEEVVIKKTKKKKKVKRVVIESDSSESESDSEILQLTKKQLKKMIKVRESPEDFEKTFPKSWDNMSYVEKKAAKFVDEQPTLESLYNKGNNYLSTPSLMNLSGKKIINRRNTNIDAFEVARVKIEPTVIDMKPKSVMKRGINYNIQDDDPGYRNLFGKGLYD